MARVDTHQLIQELIEGGLPQKPSEILGKAFLNSSNNNENYATKEQLDRIEKEQLEIKSEIKAININIKWIMAIGLLIVGILLKNTFIH
jgi:ribonuclease HIII